MLITILSRISSWMSQMVYIVDNQFSRMQPEQYMVGLTVCICLGYLLLRDRN